MSAHSVSRRLLPRRASSFAAAASLLLGSVVALAVAPSADAASTAAFTAVNTTVDGSGHCKNGDGDTNCNIYDGKQYVWLNAGPDGANLDEGKYFFAIVSSGGQSDPNDGSSELLSTDAYTDRDFTVDANGDVSYPGPHDFDATSQKIRLIPFSDSPNGVYHLQVCVLNADGTQPAQSSCKSDAFKVLAAPGGVTVDSLFSGFKYNDLNGDGNFDPGEPGLGSWQIDISVDGVDLAPVMTSATDGSWTFDPPAAPSTTGSSTYTFCEVQQGGWGQTGPDVTADYLGSPSGAGVTVTVASQCYDVVVPNNVNASVPDLNFFNTATTTTTLSGSKYLDADGNGAFTAGETKLSGWSISISSGGNPVTGSPVLTDSNGNWTFTTPERPFGTGTTAFTVCETPQTSWAQTGPVENATAVVGTGTSTVVNASKCYVVTADDDEDTTKTGLDFFNQPRGQLSGAKYYDGDTNGAMGLAEDGIEGWKVDIYNGLTLVETLTTDSAGDWESSALPPGTYTVREQQSGSANGTAWTQTGNTTDQSSVTGGATVGLTSFVYTVTVPSGVPSTADGLYFGNVCEIVPGGHTLGFWHNKNGQALTTGADFAALSAFNLVKADGTAFNPANDSQLSSWLKAATGKNMAYMLSAQMAATYLSVVHGFTDPDVVVYDGMTITQLFAYADALLLADPVTVVASTARTEQTAVKSVFDKINNNGGFAQADGTACGAPTFS